MDWKKLITNALLAGFWAGVAAFSATNEFTKPALFAAAAIAIRVAVGYVSDALGKTVSVDK